MRKFLFFSFFLMLLAATAVAGVYPVAIGQVEVEKYNAVRIYTSNPCGLVILSIRIDGATRNGENFGADQVEGKIAYLHSQILNHRHGDTDDILAEAIIRNGRAIFVFSNPAVLWDTPVEDRYWLSVDVPGENAWGYIPDSYFTLPDNQGQPGIQVLYLPGGEIFPGISLDIWIPTGCVNQIYTCPGCDSGNRDYR